MTTTTTPIDPLVLFRRPCVVDDHLVLCGDLHHHEETARRQLDHWIELGVGGIVDCRSEWDDQDLVARHAPGLLYAHVGTHDDGDVQADAWFDGGVAAARLAIGLNPTSRVMVHCHMGINRGPSMGLAILLDRGWDTIDALDAIRAARPIAAIAYAEDAVRWHLRRDGASDEVIEMEQERVREWLDDHDIDTHAVIRRIRTAA